MVTNASFSEIGFEIVSCHLVFWMVGKFAYNIISWRFNCEKLEVKVVTILKIIILSSESSSEYRDNKRSILTRSFHCFYTFSVLHILLDRMSVSSSSRLCGQLLTTLSASRAILE